ncbi:MULTISPECIES: hypothetical protein [unclassified Streptomyces]|jgi:hypothetical protein|uniref:hypothetical protein n=1 Tax=unclassified Streptomyces TaxID=2593676 RepID=UPI0040418DE7
MSLRGGDPARAWRAVDRALGGERPPTGAQMFAARRPLVVGVVAGLVAWGLFVLASEGDVLPALVVAVPAGGWFAVFARLERARQRRLVRLGLPEGATDADRPR